MNERDRRAVREYRQRRLVPTPRGRPPAVPEVVAQLGGQRALVRDRATNGYYVAERSRSGAAIYRPLQRTPEVHVRGRVPQDRPTSGTRAVTQPPSGRPATAPPLARPQPPRRPRSDAPSRYPLPVYPRASPPRPTQNSSGSPVPASSRVPEQSSRGFRGPTRGRPQRGAVDGSYGDRLAALRRDIEGLRNNFQYAQRGNTPPALPAPGPAITDPSDPRFIAPQPTGARSATAQRRPDRAGLAAAARARTIQRAAEARRRAEEDLERLPGPAIRDPLTPGFVPPSPTGDAYATAQGRSSRSGLAADRRVAARARAMQQVAEARQRAAEDWERLQALWSDLAWLVAPPQLPDPDAAMEYLNSEIETEYGTVAVWQMQQRENAARMQEALNFGNLLRESPGAAAIYGTARLAGVSASEAQAITENPGYQLTFRILSAMGVDDDDAETLAASVAVAAALVGLLSQFRRGRTSRRPQGHAAPETPRRRPNRHERRAASAIARRAPGRARRQAEARAREADSPRGRRRRNRARRGRRDETAEQRLSRRREDARRRLPYPNAQTSIPDLNRQYAQDWGNAEAVQDYLRFHEDTQGFTGIYDPVTGRLYMRPSVPDRTSVPPEGWVPRQSGHGAVAMILNDRSSTAWSDPDIAALSVPDPALRPRAFTLIRRGEGFALRWDSGTVNHPLFNQGLPREQRSLPVQFRDEVRDAILHHTGVIDLARVGPSRGRRRRTDEPTPGSRARPGPRPSPQSRPRQQPRRLPSRRPRMRSRR